MRRGGWPLAVVSLVCDITFNLQRLCSGERTENEKTKLVDVGTLEKVRLETKTIGSEDDYGAWKERKNLSLRPGHVGLGR